MTPPRPRGAALPPATMRRTAALISLLVLCALATPVAAGAASTDAILRDCVDGQIDGSYTTSELQRARGQIPSDVDEYSDCRGAIDAARTDNAGSGGRSSSGGGAGSAGSIGGSSGGGGAGPGGAASAATSDATTAPADPQNPSEAAAVRTATEAGGGAVRLGPGETVTPGATGLPTSAALRRPVPDPLLVVLILLGTVALVGAVLGTRARVVTRRLGRT